MTKCYGWMGFYMDFVCGGSTADKISVVDKYLLSHSGLIIIPVSSLQNRMSQILRSSKRDFAGRLHCIGVFC
jgi:hypothetical protein